MSLVIQLEGIFAGEPVASGGVPAGGAGTAGVLMAITRSARPEVVLTRRADHLSSHAGQIAFPGGKWEPQDLDLSHTALRESREEIGLDPQRVRLLGRLTTRESRGGVWVTPFLGLIDGADRLCASPDEIHCILPVPLDFFLDTPPLRRDRVERRGAVFDMPAWHYQGHEIWGLTAMILEEVITAMGAASTGKVAG